MAKFAILLLVITISAALAARENETFSGTCLKVAKDQNDRGGKTANSVMSERRGMMGGWEKVDMDTLDDQTAEVLAGLTELAIVTENMRANDRGTYDVSQRVEDMEVYGQVSDTAPLPELVRLALALMTMPQTPTIEMSFDRGYEFVI